MTSDSWVVTMPKLGETVTEGSIGSWLKAVGDEVAMDDPLFEVSTDKVDSEIPSPYDGVVLEILVASGETVPVGTPLIRIGEPGAVVPPPEAASAPQAASAPAIDPAPSGEIYEVTMPKLGETVTEGTVGAWLKQVGDVVAMDDPLFEVSTDKVDSEIPSPADGTLLAVLVETGLTVPVGTPIARIGEPGAVAASPTPRAQCAPQSPQAQFGGAPAPARAAGANGGGDGARPGRMLSPVVRRLASEHGLDLDRISGSGLAGRIRREDVERAIATGQAAGTTATATATAPPAPVQSAPAPAAAAATTPAAAAPGPTSSDPRDEIVTLTRMRLITAELMMKSITTSAHVWTSVEVDFEAVEQVRKRFKDAFKKDTGASLSYLPFIARATCDALRAFPVVNASINIAAKQMIMHPYVNLGIAVDLDQRGLVVPVVKDADSLNIRGVASKISSLAAAARASKLSMSDMSGSTFTITNPGPFASYASSPVINQPNVAILCTDGVTRRPVAVGDMIAIHAMGVIGLVYDHRAFDGSTASLFLRHLRDSLQDRDWAAELS